MFVREYTVRRIFLAFLVVLAGAISAPAHECRASEIEVISVDKTGLALIGLSGELLADDGEKFAAIARRFRRAVIIMDSPGGRLIAGLQIGKIIQLRHYATFSPEGGQCASACALAWLAGAPRFVQPASRIGFHAAFDAETREQTGVGNALIGAFLNQLGLSTAAIVFIESPRPDDIAWLSTADARQLGIEVSMLPASRPVAPREAPRTGPAPGQPQPMPDRRPSSRLLPLLVTPAEPGAPVRSATLDDQAKAFASDYFAHWSEGNGDSLRFFATVYASKVIFYGQEIDRTLLLQQKRNYADRWPVRVYSAIPDTMRSFCNASTKTCVVTGTVAWDCRSPARKARSTGTANFSMTIAFTNGTGQLTAESGSVISRSLN